jgi:5-methylcytosine-specific restriction endonuclease McrA
MEEAFLDDCLADGLSLEAIGERARKHPSTVSYWFKKHGLSPAGRARHAPKGNVDEARLRELVDEGASIRKMAEEFGAGYSTVRYWLARLGLQTDRTARSREAARARDAGLDRAYLRCPKHGHTAFFMRPDSGYRCARCNSAAVSERRRQVKRQLVEEAGGKCTICGFSEHPSALQFHHIDPKTKEFHLAQYGHSRGIDRARAEAKKCVLLCANCHAMVEAGTREIPAGDR